MEQVEFTLIIDEEGNYALVHGDYDLQEAVGELASENGTVLCRAVKLTVNISKPVIEEVVVDVPAAAGETTTVQV